jgi:alkylation response protein AidB-like acyl-CoA dehydrogenase
MDFSFSEAELAFREQVRAFVRAELPADIAAKSSRGIELKGDDYRRWMAILAAKGWIATNWDKKDGGPGLTLAEKYILEEELLLNGAPRPVHVGTRMVGPVLLAFGTEQQKRRYLPPILAGSKVWCQGYSEPGAGSDLAAIMTRAVRDGDHYTVDGSKIWTSFAHMSDHMFTLVRTDTTGRKQEGITVLLIDMRLPGIRIRPIRRIDGRHEFNEVFLDGVRVPVAERVGAEGDGWRVAKYLLGHERSNPNGLAVCAALLARLEAIAAREPTGDGRRLWDDPAFRSKIAAVAARLDALELTALRVLAAAGADKPVGTEASVVKLGRNEALKITAELLLECGGLYAHPFEESILRGHSDAAAVGGDDVFRMNAEYFESRRASIAGGTDEVQKDIIAKRMLGL